MVVIRHAQSEWNAARRWQGQGGTGLSELGRSQATATAKYLASVERDLALLVASDLQRVTETVAPSAEALALDVHTDPRLREIDVGRWSGLTGEQVAERDPELFAAYRRGEDVPRGGAETDAQLRRRVVAGVEDALTRCDGGTLLVFTHGGPVRAIVAEVLGMSVLASRLLAGPDNCSLTTIEVASRRRLRGYNETGHLARSD